MDWSMIYRFTRFIETMLGTKEIALKCHCTYFTATQLKIKEVL